MKAPTFSVNSLSTFSLWALLANRLVVRLLLTSSLRTLSWSDIIQSRDPPLGAALPPIPLKQAFLMRSDLMALLARFFAASSPPALSDMRMNRRALSKSAVTASPPPLARLPSDGPPNALLAASTACPSSAR